MGRGRVELKLIENKVNRQVTFAKRRNGLLKKAQELSILCDAEVALIIFSPKGKLYDFCSSPSMLKTIERYHKCTYVASEAVGQIDETRNNYQEYLKLKAIVEVLQCSQRNLNGENLDQLSTKELDQLENQIEVSLRRIRSTKTQKMLDQLCDLKRKEQMLQEANRTLENKLQEASSESALQLSWESSGDGEPNPSNNCPPTRSEGFFYALGGGPLQIRYHPTFIDQLNSGDTTHNANG